MTFCYYSQNFISNIVKKNNCIEKAVTLDGKFCCKLNTLSLELDYNQNTDTTLFEEELKLISQCIIFFENVAELIELPEEINMALANSVQKGIKDAEIRLLKEKNDIIAKQFSASNVIYNVATYIPVVGPVVNWWNKSAIKNLEIKNSDNVLSDVEVYTASTNTQDNVITSINTLNKDSITTTQKCILQISPSTKVYF